MLAAGSTRLHETRSGPAGLKASSRAIEARLAAGAAGGGDRFSALRMTALSGKAVSGLYTWLRQIASPGAPFRTWSSSHTDRLSALPRIHSSTPVLRLARKRRQAPRRVDCAGSSPLGFLACCTSLVWTEPIRTSQFRVCAGPEVSLRHQVALSVPSAMPASLETARTRPVRSDSRWRPSPFSSGETFATQQTTETA